MADKITQSSSLSFTLGFERNGETESRNFQFESFDFEPDKRESVMQFKNELLNEYNKFFQPTNWRDSDNAEDEWTTTTVKVKLIVKRETEFDG